MNYARVIKVLYKAARVTPKFHFSWPAIAIWTSDKMYRLLRTTDVQYGGMVDNIRQCIAGAKANGLYSEGRGPGPRKQTIPAIRTYSGPYTMGKK